MIKGNELDVGNIDFELCRLKEVINSYVLHCFEFKELFISLQPDVQLRWGLDQTVAF